MRAHGPARAGRREQRRVGIAVRWPPLDGSLMRRRAIGLWNPRMSTNAIDVPPPTGGSASSANAARALRRASTHCLAAWHVAAVAVTYAVPGFLAGGMLSLVTGGGVWTCSVVGAVLAGVFGGSLEAIDP